MSTIATLSGICQPPRLSHELPTLPGRRRLRDTSILEWMLFVIVLYATYRGMLAYCDVAAVSAAWSRLFDALAGAATAVHFVVATDLWSLPFEVRVALGAPIATSVTEALTAAAMSPDMLQALGWTYLPCAVAKMFWPPNGLPESVNRGICH